MLRKQEHAGAVGAKTATQITGPEPTRIDPQQIPDEDYTTGCRILASSIRRALADPDTRAEFERWKRERRKAG